MEGTEDIYVNQDLPSKPRAKKKEARTGAQRFTDEDYPDYENISIPSRSKDGALESQSVPIQCAPSKRPGPSSTQKLILCLYLLLGLSFLLGIILLSLVLVKSSEFSQKLNILKWELWNVSSTLHKEHENIKKLETEIAAINKKTNSYEKMASQLRSDLTKNTNTLDRLKNQVENLNKAPQPGPNPSANST
ncbi:uncharacterized protein LOC103106583 [Monodelphis domestica]|uniref:uncharacterized protein LOC103106583 n=1 Tax=Monodelphis domestica TaxID=13616 RepID=UPI0024E1A0C5|nr:uncharacterized protein LOC103106583 [Monodelphis domestica]